MAVANIDLLKWLGQDTSNPEALAQAQQAITTVTAMIGAYCRGQHLKSDGSSRDGIDEVVLTAASRLLANPEQLAYDSGSVSMRGGFTGFTLVELAVLNRYRKRAT